MLNSRRFEVTTAWLIVLLGAAAVGCAKSPHATGDAASETAAPMLDGPRDTGADGDALVTVGPDAAPMLPADLMAPDPPQVSCTGDGGVAACDLPPSTCSEPLGCNAGSSACLSEWIVYYDHPRCLGGRCVWDQRYFQCANHGTCQIGVCTHPATTLP